MPRLLLVDDNPSIHKIAETLLAPTDIQLVCVESAREALGLVAQGEHFDVALLDTVMAGMDGWELLDQLRMHPATAGIPIAMMAGVLDTVDPARLERAPIQGFLKKPVELRDLGDRVRKFLETPVQAAPAAPQELSPFSTLPAVKLSELPLPSAPETPAEPAPEVEEADLLLLSEADLWPELPPPPGTGTEDLSPFAEIPPEESLDLEDLDLDSLKGLTPGPQAAPAEAAPVEAAPVPAALPPVEAAPAPVPAAVPETHELPDLGPEEEPTLDPEALAALDSLEEESLDTLPVLQLPKGAPAPDPDFLAGLGETSVTPDVAVVDWSDESEKLLGTLTPSRPLEGALPEPALEMGGEEDELDLGEPAPLLIAAPAGFPLAEPEAEPWGSGEVPLLAPEAPQPEAAEAVPPSIPAPAGPPAAPDALVQALASDPALMDQLARAVVARLGDQVLREIAWEVMPEAAERLQRH